MARTEQAPRAVLAPEPLPRRGRFRLSAGHLIMIVSGLLAAVLVYSVMRRSDDSVMVAVAARRIAAAEKVDAASVRPAGVRVSPKVLKTLFRPEDLRGAIWFAVTEIAPDEPITRGKVVAAVRGPTLNIPAEVEQIAGIGVGDRVDVIASSRGTSSYVLENAEVVAIGGGGTLGGGGLPRGKPYLTVVVDAAGALRVAAALDGSKITILRTTGAEGPRPAEPYTPPGKGG